MALMSFQLFSTRNFALADTLALLSQNGFDAVEGYGPLYEDANALRAQIDQAGLSMPTGHFGLDQVESDPQGVLNTAKVMGIDTVVVPFLMPEDRPTHSEGWRAFAARLEAAAQPIMAAGLKFGWHNHDFEMKPTAEGDVPLQLIAEGAPSIGIELDLAWVAVGGEDPVRWIETFAPRLLAVHIKDRAPAGENADEDGWADVGHGVMDWGRIKAALDTAGVERYVIEHDNPKDQARFISRSAASVKAW